MSEMEFEELRKFSAYDAEGKQYMLTETQEWHMGNAQPGGPHRIAGHKSLRTRDGRVAVPLGGGKYQLTGDPPIEIAENG
jgi:hypothetical protein